ncbi:sensor histidine kinase [Patescibacteria group bacterium]|nr:sensor histidine kinase [Patescibacteria group bacterium]
MSKAGVGSRFTWVFFTVSLVGLVLINAIWLFPSLGDIEKNTSELRLEIATRAAESVEQFVEIKIRALQNTADVLRFEPGEAELLLNRLLKENIEFNTISLLDENLREYEKVSRFQVVTEQDFTDYSQYRGVQDFIKGKIYLGSVTRSQNLEPIMLVAVPIESNVLFAELNLKRLSDDISRFRVGESGKVYLIDGSGNLIIDPDLSLVLRHLNLQDRPIVQQLQVSGDVVRAAEHVNEKGVTVRATGLAIPTLNWSVIAEQDIREINILRNRIILLSILSTGIGVLLLSLLLFNSVRVIHLNRDLADYLARLSLTTSKLKELNKESDEIAKVLVRRDLELTQSNDRLRELDTIKSEFVSVAAHQLRTPLTGIKWTLNALIEEEFGRLGHDQKRLVSDGLRATHRLIELINDLLDTARIEEGRYGFSFSNQSFVPVVEHIFEGYEKIAKEKGINFLLQLPKGRLPLLSLDVEKIGIVIENLIDNAIKYTIPGGKVTVQVVRDKQYVTVKVTDTGIGIPKEQERRVFTKFFRAANAQLAQTSGTGLGLYVSQNIVKQHDGTLSFTSKENKGTIFTFSLPIPMPNKTLK